MNSKQKKKKTILRVRLKRKLVLSPFNIITSFLFQFEVTFITDSSWKWIILYENASEYNLSVLLVVSNAISYWKCHRSRHTGKVANQELLLFQFAEQIMLSSFLISLVSDNIKINRFPSLPQIVSYNINLSLWHSLILISDTFISKNSNFKNIYFLSSRESKSQ